MNLDSSLLSPSKTTTLPSKPTGSPGRHVCLWLCAAGLAALLCLNGCASNQTNGSGLAEGSPTATNTQPLRPMASALTLTPTPQTTATPTPAPALAFTAAPGTEKDAFVVHDFPWADPSQQVFPRTAGGVKARVVNSVHFADPRFFGFDLQTPSGWYHVSGGDYWATLDGRRISPTLLAARRPKDGDSVVVYGSSQDQFVAASYVGYADGTVWYYRSLLGADELLSGRLPSVYDGLQVWVRGTLVANAAEAEWYSLPEGTTLSAKRAGQEAVAGGKLQFADGRACVWVTEGIYVLDQGRYVKVLASSKPETSAIEEQGIVQTVDESGTSMSLLRSDGKVMRVVLAAATKVQFADRSAAGPSELLPGRLVLVEGTLAAGQATADRVRIISTVARGRSQAAYVAGPSGDLWSVALEVQHRGLIRRQITKLDAPEAGLADAVFSPDGSRFLFARTHGIGSALVLGEVGTGKLRELLKDDQWQERDPNWSPEGSRIVFCRYRGEGQERVDDGLWVLDLNRGTLKRLGGEAPAGWLTVAPRWSPDGQCIAYGQASASAASQCNVLVLTLPSDRRQVLEYASEWRWSADSTQLICTRQTPEETRARIWVVQKDGTSPTWLSPTRGVDDRHARVSPDGTGIAFLTRPERSHAPGALAIMQSEGTHRVQVEGQPLAVRLAWAPDSQSVVYLAVNQDAENQGLWTVWRSGFGPRQLVVDVSAFVGTFREAQ